MTVKACMVTSKPPQGLSGGVKPDTQVTIACTLTMLTDSGIKEYELSKTATQVEVVYGGTPFYFISSVSASKNEVVTSCPLLQYTLINSEQDAEGRFGVRITKISESGSTLHVDILGGANYVVNPRAYTPGQLLFFSVSRIKDSSNPDAGYFLIPAIEYSLNRKVIEDQVSNQSAPTMNSLVLFTSVDGSAWSRKYVSLPDYFKSPEFIEYYEDSGGPFSEENLGWSIQGNSNFLAFTLKEKLFYSKNGGSSWTTVDASYGLLNWYKKPNGERLLCMVIPQEDVGLVGVPLFDWAGNFILPSFSEDTPTPYTDVKWTPDMPRLDIFYHPNAMPVNSPFGW